MILDLLKKATEKLSKTARDQIKQSFKYNLGTLAGIFHMFLGGIQKLDILFLKATGTFSMIVLCFDILMCNG